MIKNNKIINKNPKRNSAREKNKLMENSKEKEDLIKIEFDDMSLHNQNSHSPSLQNEKKKAVQEKKRNAASRLVGSPPSSDQSSFSTSNPCCCGGGFADGHSFYCPDSSVHTHDGLIGEECSCLSEEIEREEEEEETRHFANVCYSFQYYTTDSMRDVARIEKHFRSLSQEEQSLLCESIDERIDKIKHAIQVNQNFIDLLLLPQLGGITHEEDKTNCCNNNDNSYDKNNNNDKNNSNNNNNNNNKKKKKKKKKKNYNHHSIELAKDDHHFLTASGVQHNVGGIIEGDTDRADSSCSPSLIHCSSKQETLIGGSGNRCLQESTEKRLSNENDTSYSQHDLSLNDSRSLQSHPRPHHISPLQRVNFNSEPSHDHAILVRNMSKVRSTLRQFVRDWSVEGYEERNTAYGPLLQSLDDYLPIKEKKKPPRVLCPGSGLGRLPFEVVVKGYVCQGNEFSYFMLLGSNFILNYAIRPKSCLIMPYCLSTSNRRNHDDHLQEIYIPDTCPSDVVSFEHDFSMCAGEFVEVFSSQKEEWDAVLTCYFIDTAKNILLYIQTIAKILRVGGLWSNFGPLLYHFAEMPDEMSIELSWEEIEAVIKKYFTFKVIEWRDSYYTTNSRSMMQMLYHCVFFIAIRNDFPVTINPPHSHKCNK